MVNCQWLIVNEGENNYELLIISGGEGDEENDEL